MNIVGRYVARLLLSRFAVVLLGLAALMILMEFLADSDQLIASSDNVVQALLLYTILKLPAILSELIPVAALIGGLLAFAGLARHSELAAIYAAGMSKARLGVAVLPMAALIGGFQLAIEDQAQPLAVGELRAWGVGDYNDDATAVWLRRGGDIIHASEIDAEAGELRGVTIFRRDDEGNFVAKIAAERAASNGGAWTLFDVTRSVVGAPAAETEAEVSWEGDLNPADLGAVVTNPAELPLSVLVRFARQPEAGVQPAYRYRLALHERIASPLATMMLILLTVALAHPARGREAMMVATGIGVGFVLWTFDGLVLSLGHLGLIPPMLAAWTPVAVTGTTATSIGLLSFGPRRSAAPPRPADDPGAVSDRMPSTGTAAR